MLLFKNKEQYIAALIEINQLFQTTVEDMTLQADERLHELKLSVQQWEDNHLDYDDSQLLHELISKRMAVIRAAYHNEGGPTEMQLRALQEQNWRTLRFWRNQHRMGIEGKHFFMRMSIKQLRSGKQKLLTAQKQNIN